MRLSLMIIEQVIQKNLDFNELEIVIKSHSCRQNMQGDLNGFR